MDHRHTGKLCAVLGIKGIQIRLVLEIVCIQITGIQRIVRKHIICVLYNL